MSSYRESASERKTPKRLSKMLIGSSAIGFVVFFIVQMLLPLLFSGELGLSKHLTKEQALERAMSTYAQEIYALPSLSSTSSIETAVIYETNDLLSGYISKEQLTKSYEPWEQLAPYDVYRVLISRVVGYGQEPEKTIIDIHMTTGKLVSYQTTMNAINTSAPKLDNTARISITDQKIREMGYTDAQLQRQPLSDTNPNEIRYHVPAAKVGDATLQLVARWQQDKLVSIKPIWNIPASYSEEILFQLNTAETIQTYGYVILSFIMGVAAVICALVYRRSLSFRSRTAIILAVLSCGISILHIWNMLPGSAMLELQIPIQSRELRITFTLQALITFIQGGVTLYLALITGRELWLRTARSDLMITWNHPNFGRHLIHSFWSGLCWAGILLGLQSIIFAALETGYHAWSSSDAASSPLNLSNLYLYPMLAWVAAISEEGFYRLFGVGLLRKWIPNTWIAAILPTFVWAAGHVMYPIYPFYSRPIELMILGLLFVFIMIRYGFWTAVIAHLMLDTLLMVLSLMLEFTLQGFLFGLFYLLLPVAVVYIIIAMHARKKPRPISY